MYSMEVSVTEREKILAGELYDYEILNSWHSGTNQKIWQEITIRQILQILMKKNVF